MSEGQLARQVIVPSTADGAGGQSPEAGAALPLWPRETCGTAPVALRPVRCAHGKKPSQRCFAGQRLCSVPASRGESASRGLSGRLPPPPLAAGGASVLQAVDASGHQGPAHRGGSKGLSLFLLQTQHFFSTNF